MKRKAPTTKEQRRQQGRETRAQMRQDVRKHPALFTTYVVYRRIIEPAPLRGSLRKKAEPRPGGTAFFASPFFRNVLS